MPTAEEVIQALELQKHPMEGGFFHETYRSRERHLPGTLGSRYSGSRSFKTAIYYLLTPGTFSSIHRLPGDEMFHFYLGDPVRMLQLFPAAAAERTLQLFPPEPSEEPGPAPARSQVLIIGNDILAGQRPQVVVPGGAWQGCLLEPGGEFALMGTTMAPGFDYTDYEAGRRQALIAEYPDQAELIRRLTNV